MTDPSTITITLHESATPQLELEAAELHFTVGPNKGLKVELGADSLRVGSAADCEIVLHDSTVSSYHAEIQVTRQGYIIRDLRSKNGIKLGKWLVNSAVLADGMKLRLGASEIKVRSLGKQHCIVLRRPGRLGPLVARSMKMRAVGALLEDLADAEITVLIEGETGTGKEVVARTLHQLSHRARGPFVVADCGAIPPHLFGAELFGHERGAYTDAATARAGLLEAAEGGTLFIDEVGETPLEIQPLLLRAIERKESRRIGGQRLIAHDIRIITATNRNLAEESRGGRFREDLFYRLAVGRVRVPALRERREDIEELARIFAEELGVTLTPQLCELLEHHDWPGNVRELRNVVARAALPGGAQALGPELIGASEGRFRQAGALIPLSEARQLAAGEFERDYLLEALAAANNNLSQAARLAGVSRGFIMRLAQRHNLLARDRKR